MSVASLKVIALQLLVVLFLGVLGTIVPHQNAVVRVLAQLVVLPVAVVAVFGARRRPATPLDLPILIALALYLVVAMASEDRTVSLQTVGMVGGWVILFVVMAEIAKDMRLRQAVATAVAAVMTTWLIVLAVAWIGEKITWVRLGGGMPNLFESTQSMVWLTVNAIPVLALAGAPFLAYLRPGSMATALRTVFAAAAVITIPLSGGRAGWVGLIVAGLALLVLSGNGVRSLVRRRSVQVAGSAAVAMAVVATALFADRVFTISGLSARFPLWGQAMGIFGSDPLTGGGPGTFAWLRLTYADEYASRVPAILAHDVPIQTLADGGILLSLALAFVVGTLLWALWRNRFRLSQPARWSVAALAGYSATSLLDDHSSLPAITAMVITLVAWVTAELPKTHEARSLPGWAVPIAGAAVIVAAIPFVARIDMARLSAEDGRSLALRGDLATAAMRFEDSADWHPENPLYLLENGIVRSLMGDLEAARDDYRAAASLSPGDPRPLGALADLSSDANERIGLLDRAARLTGDDPQYAYRLGIELLATGEVEPGSHALALAATIEPTILGTVATQADLQTAHEAATRARELAISLHERLRLDVATFLDDLDLFLGGEPVGHAHRAVAMWTAGDEGAARRALSSAVAEDPYDIFTWGAAAYTAHDSCDAQAYRRAALLRFWSPGGARPYRSDSALRMSLDLPYREIGLGNFQPNSADRRPIARVWPSGLVPEPVACPGWDLAELEDPFR